MSTPAMDRSRQRAPLRRLALLALLMVAPLAGCRPIGAILFFLSPRQVTPTEYKLTSGRLVILIEAGRPHEENAVFVNAFHEKLVEYLKERAKLKATIVSQDEITRLRREHPDFRQWGVQEVGRALNADEVLYFYIDELALYEAPGSPLLYPRIRMHQTVIGTLRPSSDPRAWPPSDIRRGREVSFSLHPREATSLAVLDEELRKLARAAAWVAAAPFYDFDREEAPPREM